jgi:hypothetical protein
MEMGITAKVERWEEQQPAQLHNGNPNQVTDALSFDLAPTMAQRVTLRKRQPYNTTSNRRRVVKTPGGKLVYHHIKKLATSPKCGDCGISLPGVRFPARFLIVKL